MKKELKSPVLLKHLDSITEPSSREEIKKNLIIFEEFVDSQYNSLIDEAFVLDRLEGEVKNVRNDKTGKKIDVYQMFTEFGTYLIKKNPNVGRIRVRLLFHAAKMALNHAAGNLVQSDTFKVRVKNLPSATRNKKTTIDETQMKRFLFELMNNGSSLRLRTLAMLLVSGGLRIGEALQVKYKDLYFDADPPRIHLSAEITKWGVERDVYLTREMVEILKKWIEYKHRPRTIVKKVDGQTIREEYEKPESVEESYLFKVRHENKMKKYEETDVNNYRSVYEDIRDEFRRQVDEIFIKKQDLGRKFSNGRNSISLHSLRWYCRTQVKKVTHDEIWAYFWVGKESAKVTYNFEPTEEEIREIYKLIEPKLTFLNPTIINQIGEGHQAEINLLKAQMKQQRKDFLIDKFERKLEVFNRDYVHEYIINGELKPIPSDIPKEKLDKWLKDFNDPKLTLEELAIITPQEVIKALEPINEDDRDILNKYVEENESYLILDLPNIAAAELGISVDEVRNKIRGLK